MLGRGSRIHFDAGVPATLGALCGRAGRFCALALVSIAALTTLGADAIASPATTVVSAGGAHYRGAQLASGVVAFRGIPFALPPVGERRWRLPEPAPETSGSVDATRFAPACMQSGSGVAWYHKLMRRVGADPALFPAPAYAEDCLYLNIWTDPALEGDRPVLVYIHGGSNTGGWSYEPNYRGARLAERGAVVVSVAYRLGVFGFLTHPELPGRNFALHDLALSLQWVQKNIAAFGGDPQRITLVGESAGAANASHLMVSPLSAGIAKRLIHQSGGWQFDGLAQLDEAEALGVALEQRLADGAGLAALRRRDASEVLSAAAEIYQDFYFSPVPDPVSLPGSLGELAGRGALPAFDLLLGTNADEALMYLDAETTLDGWLRENVSRPARAAVRAQLVPAGSANEGADNNSDWQRIQLNRLQSAAQFACPSRRFADAVVAADGRSFVYRFTRMREGFAAVGAYHGAELPYMFDTHDSWLPTGPIDRHLTAQMVDYWLSFAATGQPRAKKVVWPDWTPDSPEVLLLGDEIRPAAFPDKSLCDALGLAFR